MADYKEREKVGIPEGVTVRPEEFEVPPELERIEKKEGLQPTKTQFTASVRSDSGKPLIQAPLTQTVSIQLPADDQALTAWSKGPTDNALTWFSVFWLRLIKKALHFGWRIIRGVGK